MFLKAVVVEVGQMELERSNPDTKVAGFVAATSASVR